MRYRETSKIVRVATREAGVLSAIAKGALRPKSRFGAALQPLSDGVAQLILSDHRDLHTMAEFELTHLRSQLALDMERYAAAVVMAEIMLRFAPANPHPESFDVFQEALSLVEVAPLDALESVALRTIWLLVSELGFGPSLDHCVRDGRPIASEGDLWFSAAEGGGLCRRCAPPTGVARLDAMAHQQLRALLSPGLDMPDLDRRHGTAHRRLLARYIRHHLADGADLPALRLWTAREMEHR